jgi:phenylacetate-CoA ligase
MPRTPEAERLYWSREQIAGCQLERLRASVEAAARSPHYAPRLSGVEIKSLDDLRRLPLTTKEDVRAASPFGLVAVERERLFQYHESFGTTGAPASSWLTEADLNHYADQINQAALDLHPGDRLLVRFPYAISVPAHIVTQAARRRGACVIPASSRTSISPYPRVIDLLTRLETTVLGCLPMEAILLAEAALKLGRDPARDFPHLRAIGVAGEMLSDARKARIAALWNARVVNMYGCTEAGNIATDCPAGRLHLAWDHFLLEALDPATLDPAPPGRMGIAALTTLTREAMPLVRYLLGDYLRLIEDHGCPCGRQAPVVDHYGRDLNRFEFAGQGYFVRDLEDRLLDSPVEALGNLWLIEVRPQVVRFRVEASRPDPELYRRLEARIGDELGLPLVIDAVAPGGLMDRERLLRIDPVNKPRVVGYVTEATTPALTLDNLMQGG